jgi:hypothetical protein
MARKPEAASPAEPKKRKMTQAEQSKLFIKTARELGVDESEEEFERVFDKIVKPKRRSEKNR